MLKKFLKDAMALIAGKPAEDLVDLLDTNKHVNEFVIAKKLDLTINQTRNILYKISDHGLVSSIRKKDKRKGWYTYFWKIETLKSLEFIRNDLTKKIDNLEHQVKGRETKRFYFCERCHVEFNEENALFNNFTCPECGAILALRDNTKLVSEMKRNLEKVKRDLSFVQEEINKESGTLEKKRTKEMKSEISKKKKEQKQNRSKRKAAKEADLKSKAKKSGKRNVFKKILPKKKVKKSKSRR